MRGFSSPAIGYLLTCGLVVASLTLATLADSKLGAPPSLHGGPLAGPALGGNGFTAPAGGNTDGDAAARHWRDAQPAADAVVLTAALVGRTPANSLALVAVNGAPAVAARPGDVLPGGYRVLAVDADALTYQAGARQVRVKLQPGAAAPASPEAPAVAQAQATTPAAPALAGDNEAFRQAVEQRLASLRH